MFANPNLSSPTQMGSRSSPPGPIFAAPPPPPQSHTERGRPLVVGLCQQALGLIGSTPVIGLPNAGTPPPTRRYGIAGIIWGCRRVGVLGGTDVFSQC